MSTKIKLRLREAQHLKEISIDTYLNKAFPNWQNVRKESLGATLIYDKNNQALGFNSPEHLFKYLLKNHYDKFPKDLKEMWVKFIKSPKNASDTEDKQIINFLKAYPKLYEFLSWSSGAEAISKEQYDRAEVKTSQQGKHTSTKDIYANVRS